MSARAALSSADVARELAALAGWEVRGGKLHREFSFGTFAEAFGFMTSVAIHAQAMDHHPDWCNSYTKVVVDLISHDVGGLSQRDFRLAAKMDALFRARGGE